MTTNQKDYVSYEFKVSEQWSGIRAITIHLTLDDDKKKWKGFRHLVSLGSRLETYLKSPLVNTTIGTVGMKVYLDASTDIPKKQVEDALHSLYLFMEHPEKYA